MRIEDIIKLALGPGKASDLDFTTWEALLSEIITGDAFGVDRMDYLLRDSYHSGVVYGKFDHFRLIDTMRILPQSPSGCENDSDEPALGVDTGGLQSAEALLLARYFMYSQVYFHRVRRIYDIHLKDFLKTWLENGAFSINADEHLRMTDNEITKAILEASRDPASRGHDAAVRLTAHQHFRLLYQRNPYDVKINPEAAILIYEAAKDQFGEENVRYDSYSGKSGITEFPVRLDDGRIASSISVSNVLKDLPVPAFDYIFVDPVILSEAQEWLEKRRENIISPAQEE